MRLTELEPEFLKWLGPEKPDSCQRVPTMAEADGLWFLCPLCFFVNGGPIGTHGIKCWHPRIPQTVPPTPGRWEMKGTGFGDLSLVAGSSSIALGGGCAWHGYVQNGEVHTDLDPARVDAERRRQAEWRAQWKPAPLPEPGVPARVPRPVPLIGDRPMSAPEGYVKTHNLKFIDGILHQLHLSGHGPGNPEHWEPVESEKAVEAPPAGAPADPPAA